MLVWGADCERIQNHVSRRATSKSSSIWTLLSGNFTPPLFINIRNDVEYALFRVLHANALAYMHVVIFLHAGHIILCTSIFFWISAGCIGSIPKSGTAWLFTTSLVLLIARDTVFPISKSSIIFHSNKAWKTKSLPSQGNCASV